MREISKNNFLVYGELLLGVRQIVKRQVFTVRQLANPTTLKC
jgi:hypothetical protein